MFTLFLQTGKAAIWGKNKPAIATEFHIFGFLTAQIILKKYNLTAILWVSSFFVIMLKLFFGILQTFAYSILVIMKKIKKNIDIFMANRVYYARSEYEKNANLWRNIQTVNRVGVGCLFF